MLFFSGLSLIFIFFFISKEPSNTIILNEASLKKNRLKTSSLKTLSNDFLDQAVFRRKSQIESCLKNKKAYGALTFEMTVLNSGSNKIRLIESHLENRGALQCIIVLLEKIRFPSFKDTQILRTYAIQILPKE